MRTAYLKTLCELAGKDRNVYALISDNGAIVYDAYRKDFPKQYLNLGISEANMLGMAAGLASRGKIPFAYTIGSFLAYRALEFIRNDICLQNMNVKIVGIGAGESYSFLGSTHHATEDLGALRSLPNLVILSPGSPKEVANATKAAYEKKGPVYLRLGTNRESEIYSGDYTYTIGKAVTIEEGEDIAIFSTGSILKNVLDATFELQKEGIKSRVVNIHTIKPFDREAVVNSVRDIGRILTVEDHNRIGGLGSATAEAIAESGEKARFERIGLEDFSHGYGTYEEVKQMNGIGMEKIKEKIREMVKA